MSQIQDHIKDLQEQRSQAQIAASVGASQSLISRWAAGDIPAAADVALRLVELHRATVRSKKPKVGGMSGRKNQPKEQAHG